MNNLNLLNDLRRSWWYFIIANIISKCIDLLIRHTLQMVYQSTFSSKPAPFFSLGLFYLWTWSLCNFNLRTSSLLINFIITYHTWISFSFKPGIFWQFPSCFQVSSYFLSFLGCCECWLPCTRLSLYYERHW